MAQPLRYQSPYLENKKNSQRIPRECLKCDRPFIARGRFNRLCPRCREINAALSCELSETVHVPYGFNHD